jgi:hypothetical protein
VCVVEREREREKERERERKKERERERERELLPARGGALLYLSVLMISSAVLPLVCRSPRDDSIWDEYKIDPLDKTSDAAYDYAAKGANEFSGAPLQSRMRFSAVCVRACVCNVCVCTCVCV